MYENLIVLGLCWNYWLTLVCLHYLGHKEPVLPSCGDGYSAEFGKIYKSKVSFQCSFVFSHCYAHILLYKYSIESDLPNVCKPENPWKPQVVIYLLSNDFCLTWKWNYSPVTTLWLKNFITTLQNALLIHCWKRVN